MMYLPVDSRSRLSILLSTFVVFFIPLRSIDVTPVASTTTLDDFEYGWPVLLSMPLTPTTWPLPFSYSSPVRLIS